MSASNAAVDTAAQREEVASVMRRIRDAWTNRRYDELASLFDERIVMALPGFAGRVEGRDALVDSYREFMDRSTLVHYEEDPPAIDIFGDTAIATFHWSMQWVTQDVENRPAGSDAFVLRRVGPPAAANRWIAVWRTMPVESGA